MCTWVALKTSVNSWDHPTEISLRFFVSLWNSSSGILGFLVCDQNWEKIEKEWYRFWDFPSHYRVLASHDRRHDESNIGGFNKCSHNNLQLYNRAGPRGYQVWPFWWVWDGLPSKSVLIKLGLHTAHLEWYVTRHCHDISWHVKSQDLLFSKLGFFSLSFFSFSCFRSGICICFQNPNSKITQKKETVAENSNITTNMETTWNKHLVPQWRWHHDFRFQMSWDHLAFKAWASKMVQVQGPGKV